MDKEKLFNENIKLVPYVITKILHISTKEFDFDDIMQEGYIALWKAVNTYSADKNVQFNSYACNCIKNKVIKYLNLTGRQFYKYLLVTACSFEEYVPDSETKYIKDIVPAPVNDILLLRELEKVLEELSKEDYRVNILLDIIEGATIKEEAEKYNVTTGQIHDRLYLLRKKIKKILIEKGLINEH